MLEIRFKETTDYEELKEIGILTNGEWLERSGTTIYMYSVDYYAISDELPPHETYKMNTVTLNSIGD